MECNGEKKDFHLVGKSLYWFCMQQGIQNDVWSEKKYLRGYAHLRRQPSFQLLTPPDLYLPKTNILWPAGEREGGVRGGRWGCWATGEFFFRGECCNAESFEMYTELGTCGVFGFFKMEKYLFLSNLLPVFLCQSYLESLPPVKLTW